MKKSIDSKKELDKKDKIKKLRNNKKRKKKKSKHGFTLIELLAVIVILGLLMAIAIPSVTKYITESRKKTLTTTIDNYMSALTTQVNDMEYTFTKTNTIYAVPIECIALERGGTDPFGEWYQASNSYWAYVLVQYDDETSSYTYGFTFKDSAGYGLYPTSTEKLNESGKQINTNLDLNRPMSNKISNITIKQNWSGFVIDDNTNLVVLEATSEGETGNGKTTCTLYQKGDNYEFAEQEKKDKWKIGREICFGSECFNIISSDANYVTMLAKEKIDVTTNNPKQNANAESVIFSTNRYWIIPGGGWDLKPEYSGDYPVYIYDDNSNVYQYIKSYENTIRNMGISSVSASLISKEQVDYINTKDPSHPWFNKSYGWYTGTFGTALNIYRCRESGCGYENYTHNMGIRPIITVDKIEINFN